MYNLKGFTRCCGIMEDVPCTFFWSLILSSDGEPMSRLLFLAVGSAELHQHLGGRHPFRDHLRTNTKCNPTYYVFASCGCLELVGYL